MLLFIGDDEKAYISLVFENDRPFYFIQILDFISFEKIMQLINPFYTLFITERKTKKDFDLYEEIDKEEYLVLVEKIKKSFYMIKEKILTTENEENLEYIEEFDCHNKNIAIDLSNQRGIIMLTKELSKEKMSN